MNHDQMSCIIMHLLHVRNLTCATSYGQVRLCTIHLDVRTLDNAGLQVFSGIYFLFLVGFFFGGGESSDSVALDSFSLGLLGFYVLYYWVFELSDPSTCWWPIASTFVGSSTVHSWFEVDCSREAQG